MQGERIKTKVEVSGDTHGMLKNLKREYKAHSMDEVINILAGRLHDQGYADDVEDEEEDATPAPEKKRNLNVRKALYLYEAWAERKGMLKFLTGFHPDGVDFLKRHFAEVEPHCSFFFECHLS